MSTIEEHDAAQETLLIADAKLRFILFKQGEQLAKKHGYPDLTGMDALCRYFADKYHWLPAKTRQLSTDDLSLLLKNAK